MLSFSYQDLIPDLSTDTNRPILIPTTRARRTVCTILPDGGVKPLWDDEDAEYNVLEKPYIWNETGLFREIRSIDFDCKDCDWFLFCAGSCRLMSYPDGIIRSKHPAYIDRGVEHD